MTKNLQQIAEKALMDSVVRLVWQKTDEETGELLIWPRASGFFVAPNLIATNIHCVTGAPSVFAEIVSTKAKFPVEGVVAFDAENDLVILKVAGEGIPLLLEDSNRVQVGETVCAVGHPRAKAGEATQVTISGIQNSDKSLEIKEEFDSGHSGSAILNNSGKVIGVTVATGMLISVLSSDGLAFFSYAIPVSTLDRLLANVVEAEPFAEWQKRPQIRAYTEIRKGQTELDQRKYRESIVCFDTALELNPNLADAYINRAGANLSLGHHKEAIADCDNALKLNPHHVMAYINRSAAKHFLGEAEDAIDDCNAALELNPNYAMAYNNRAGINLSLEHYKEAIADCDIALKLDPNLVQSYICRATAKLALEQDETVLADYDTALELAPDSAEIYVCRANMKFMLEDYAGAIEDYDKTISLNPELGSSLNVYGRRADAKYYLRDYEGAKKDYDKVIQLNPKSQPAHFNRGQVKYYLGKSKTDQGNIPEARADYQGAVEDYTEAIKLDPEYASVYNCRGWTQYLLGQFDYKRGNTEEARKLFEAAVVDSDEAIRLSLDDPSPHVYHTRAAAKAALGAYREAIEDFNETIQMKPDEARYYYDRGLANQAFGQHEAAKTDFQKAKALDPDVENKSF